MTEAKPTRGPLPGPYRLWQSHTRDHYDKYPEPHEGNRRLLDANDICIGILFGGYLSIPRLEATHELLVEAGTVYSETGMSPRQLAEQRAELLHELAESRCPGGGWTGMPDGIDPTVRNCMADGACGCSAGDAITRAEGRQPPEQGASSWPF